MVRVCLTRCEDEKDTESHTCSSVGHLHAKRCKWHKSFFPSGSMFSRSSPFDKPFRTWNTRWRFQIFFIFTPTWARFPLWTHIFQWGWFNHQLVTCVSSKSLCLHPGHGRALKSNGLSCRRCGDYARWAWGLLVGCQCSVLRMPARNGFGL